VGQPFSIRALAASITGFARAEGTFLIFDVPSTTTFRYYAKAKVGTNGQVLATTTTQLRAAGFYTGASVGTPTFSVASNGSSGSFTTAIQTTIAQNTINFVGTAPPIGAPLSGTGINPGTQITGVFGTLNPGGYGAGQTPAGIREIADILTSNYSILDYNGTLTYTGSTTPVTTELLYTTDYNSTIAQLIAGGTTQSFDLATLIGVNYVDAVYKSIYYNWFDGDGAVTPTPGSNIIGVIGNINQFTNAKYIKIFVGETIEIYEIVSVNTNASTIVINATFTDASDEYNFEVAYESTVYFANTYNINKCLHSKIAQLSLSTCSCKNKSTEKLYEAVMMYMSIQPNMDLGKPVCKTTNGGDSN
jgi:hypothetical protein